MKFINQIKALFTPIEPLASGIYHYQSPASDPLNYRLHLRLEPDGNGILMINASTILHLNQTAAELAYHLVSNTPPDEAAKQISSRYRISKKTAKDDYQSLEEQIETLLTTPDLDPVTYFGFERHVPYTDNISAPYRLDCAITYQLPDNAPAGSAPVKRVDRELSTEEWKTIIDKAWDAGIPHILFTGGEPTLREDLPELISHAEKNGQVTGLITNGLKLSDTSYLNTLLQSGLDHTMIILEPEKAQTWESLSSFAYWTETLNEDIFITAHITLTKENAGTGISLIDKLTEAGISAISLSESDRSLSDELQITRDYANEHDIDLVWDLPVPYSSLNPVALELELEEDEIHPSGAGKGWLYVEPDGDVLPGQGINTLLGNFLENEWETIWQSAKNYR